jgi:hypothetical protein
MIIIEPYKGWICRQIETDPFRFPGTPFIEMHWVRTSFPEMEFSMDGFDPAKLVETAQRVIDAYEQDAA